MTDKELDALQKKAMDALLAHDHNWQEVPRTVKEKVEHKPRLFVCFCGAKRDIISNINE